MKEEEQTTPFLYLSLEIPSAPLFKDAIETMSLPQVPLPTLLAQIDGHTVKILPTGEERRMVLERLPPFLILHYRRFAKNVWFVEKNPTIVNFPVRGLDLRDYVLPSALLGSKEMNTMYDLVANIRHEGQPDKGSWRVHIQHEATGKWYEMQDLHVQEIMPELIGVSEAYIQIWKQRV